MSSKDYKDKIFVSEYNQYDEVLKKVNIPEKITVDVTDLDDTVSGGGEAGIDAENTKHGDR